MDERGSRPLRTLARGTALLASTALAVTGLLAGSGPAAATYRGVNGLIAYATWNAAIGDFELYTANPDGTHVVRVSPGAGVSPDWSPDSTRLAFDFWDGSGVQIATVDPDGRNLLQITSGPSVHEGASWTPDGTQIVYGQSPPFTTPEEFFTSIYIMYSDGTNPHPIGEVSHEAFDVEPKVSPDGKRIVFMRLRYDDAGNQEMALHVMRLDGSRVRRITAWNYGVEHPKWSPDSRWIIFNGGARNDPASGSNRAIYVVRPDGSGLHAIYRAGRNEALTKPGFSPDGKLVLFVCTTFEPVFKEELCVMRRNGSHVRQITDTPITEQQPAWGSAPLR